jgi:hypothetical protein
MLQSDFAEVEFLFKLKSRLEKALVEADKTIHEITNDRPDSGGFENFNIGYYSHVHKHSDGSGQGIDMSGCYVGLEVAEYAKAILQGKLKEVHTRLNELRVTLDNTDEKEK